MEQCAEPDTIKCKFSESGRMFYAGVLNYNYIHDYNSLLRWLCYKEVLYTLLVNTADMANAEGDSTKNVYLIFLSIRLRKSLINRMIYSSRRLSTSKKSS